MGAAPPNPWLVLIHQLPPKPAYLRVKVWRRLQALGSIPLKNSVYALPNTDEAREDLEWVLREIQKEGGEASLCEARPLDRLTDDEVRSLFLAARESDYRSLATDIRKFAHETFSTRSRSLSDDARSPTESALARFRNRPHRLLRLSRTGGRGRPPRRPRRAPLSGPTRGGESAAQHAPDRGRSEAHLGHPEGRPHRPHRLRLADPQGHRPRAGLQVRPRSRLLARPPRDPLLN